MATSTASILCGLTLALLLADVGSLAQSAEPGTWVRFIDLDPAVPEDAAKIYSAIKRAARLVCIDSSSPWDAKRMEYIQNCSRAVVADAVERIDEPLLTALHHRGDQRERLGLAAQ